MNAASRSQRWTRTSWGRGCGSSGPGVAGFGGYDAMQAMNDFREELGECDFHRQHPAAGMPASVAAVDDDHFVHHYDRDDDAPESP